MERQRVERRWHIATLEMKKVNKVFGKGPVAFTALKDIEFEIPDKEFCCVIGPSGCGKTTLLRIIGGFYEATSGNVVVGGDTVTKPGSDRGVVFQDYALFPWLDVIGNAAFGLKMQGVPKREREATADKYLKMAGLMDFRNTATFNLSGGMRQRVAIVRALVNDPEILLMDEPFGALDALTREDMELQLMKIWKQTQKTVVFITHDIEEAILLSTRLVILKAKPGEVKEIIDLPFSREFPLEGDLQMARELKTQPEFIEMRQRAVKAIVEQHG